MEDSNSLMEVDIEPSNFADEYENESVQSSDQEHEEEQPDEKLGFDTSLSKSSLLTPCTM